MRDLLPTERTSFVGRSRELARLETLFEEGAPLVTVTGAAGIGKTRLVVRSAKQLAERGIIVFFCDLSEAQSAADLTRVVGDALDLRLKGEITTEEVGHALAGRREALVVLDNCEQLAAAVAVALEAWLELAPEAMFLVTSRERLRLAGEWSFELDPLSLAARGEQDRDLIRSSEAFRLFETRARAADAAFRVEDAEVAALGEILQELDGLPLAIELCAARASMLGLEQIRALLSRRFDLLVVEGRDAQRRQATLRRTLDWSWALLSEHERDALAQCSVFRGGFTIEAATEVLARETGSPGSATALEALRSLHDRSLLRAESHPEAPGERRFRLYESVRAYADEKLVGAVRAVAIARHAAHYAAVGREHDPAQRTARVLRELDNFIAVVERLERGEVLPAFAFEALLALGPALSMRGSFELYGGLLDRALASEALPAASSRLRAGALCARGLVRRVQARMVEARQDLEEAVALAASIEEPTLEGKARAQLAILDLHEAKIDAAVRGHEQALTLLSPLDDQQLVGTVLLDLANTHLAANRFELAESLTERACRTLRKAGDRRGLAEALGSMAVLRFQTGRASEAHGFFAQAIAGFVELGDRQNEAHSRSNLAVLLQEVGRCDEALAEYSAGLARFDEVGARHFGALYRAYRATLHHERGRFAEALEDYEAAIARLRVFRPRQLGLFLGSYGALLAETGRVAEAAAHFNEAELLLAPGTPFRVAVDIHRIHLERALGQSAELADRIQRAEEIAARSHRVRFALRLLARERQSDAIVPEPAHLGSVQLVVGEGSSWFELGASGRVDLRRRGAMRRLLLHLLDQRVAAPSVATSVETMIEVGWPGEKMLGESGTDRVYTTIQRLRRLGLGSALITRDDGYLLDPTTTVRFSED